MLRDVWDFRNVLLVEQPNRDYGHTLMRQFLFDHFHLLMLRGLVRAARQRVAEIASEEREGSDLSRERSAELIIALGDGTDESHRRMQDALDRLFPFCRASCSRPTPSTRKTRRQQGIAPLPYPPICALRSRPSLALSCWPMKRR